MRVRRARAFGFQPIQNQRVETHAHGDLAPDVTQAHHARQLFPGEARDVIKIDVRFVPGGLATGSVPQCLALPVSPFPVLYIFGCHAFQLCVLR